MTQPRAMILRAPGTNCDLETAHAFCLAGAETQTWHVARLVEDPRGLRPFQILCIPGGFSYGDDLAAGRILGSQLQSRLADAMRAFLDHDRLILGICNGFQVLMRSGLLWPEAPADSPLATLTWNDSGRFEDRWIRTRTEGDRCVFLRGMATIFLPVAHAEGKFVARDSSTLVRLAEAGQLVLRYASERDDITSPVPFPDNPNGSQADVAGMCDATGRVLGLMPHPERFVDRTQHPYWTRLKEESAEGEGLAIFKNAVDYFR